ncbi:LOW QUALITY PROTEIN: meiotically up-regulated gene 184 protein-like [Cajanus cajan]|uniref:LOW QUALITY PROTEIN: meiotically up-regulated gene 184 protein-like n=1 Tax=Cajanus cajan TaxID=3821 RepID=UPI00098DC8B0|nr:LOW QUALITY PROTEIN: meiotically up-regulated gene 184 protein-like [Cajanus cajan]
MECNKDEAVRARQIAEARMQRGEFVEAIRFAAKAKKLYSEVENITQILTICEVHIAAQKKVSASDMDWYAILQIERLADEATIKKQYRRLALLLHPDKNKFAGAEAAFKLIGQANGVLSDQAKRSFYDRNFEASVRGATPKSSCRYSNGNVSAAKHDANATNCQKTFDSQRYSNVNVFAANHDANAANYQKNSNLNSTSFSNQVGQKTFWTSCQHCNTKYQYCVLVVNATLRCQQCLKIFKAHVIQFSYQGVSPAFFTSVNNPKEATMHGPPKSASESTGGNSVSMKKCAAGTGDHCEDRKSKDGYVPPSRGTESQTSKNVGRKRVRQSAPDSKDSFNGRNGAEMKNANVGGNDVDSSRLNARRSSRKKQNVSYVETSEDDDISYVENSEDDDISYVETSEDGDSEILSKKPRQNGPLNTDEDEKENMPESGGSSNNNNPGTSAAGVTDQMSENVPESDIGLGTSEEDNCSPLNSNAPSAPKVVVCPDTDFNDFEKGKEEDCFAVNQLWAIYDDFDGMPRFYALVKKAAFPFKLRITWLEPDPDDQGETDWHDAKLPIACGKFRLGRSQNTTDRFVFSHQIRCIKGRGKGSYLVCPNKGEIWAIFRNWDIKWSSNPKEHSEYDLEYVEILSDFVENVGIAVAYLGKVKGFVSLFQKIAKNGVNMFYVLPNELYRFSHRIPSYKMTGNEREGVPIGSFELDPAALPFQFNLFEVGDSGMVNGG